MAEKNLKGIKFPGLPEIFMVAPGGYGLGGTGCVTVLSLFREVDNIWANGWYALYCPDLLEIDGFSFHSAMLEVSAYNENHGHQTLRFLGTNSSLHRAKIDGVLQPWEWENPPLAPWQEYRTSERYCGKSVYVQVFEMGEPVNGKSLGIQNYGCDAVVRYCADLSGIPLPYTTTGSYTEWQGIAVSVTPSEIAIHCGDARTGYGYVNATLWYTKENEA